jgi:hypothetical protein
LAAMTVSSYYWHDSRCGQLNDPFRKSNKLSP